jgi:hypothetical protein
MFTLVAEARMRGIRTAFLRRTTAALVGIGLGFGAAQAFAKPAQCGRGAVCSPSSCTLTCKRKGFAGGDCVNGVCVCWST